MANLLSNRITSARKKAGLTQEDLAKRLNIAYSTLNKYEKGHRIPDAILLSQMANILDCDPGWLLSGPDEKNNLTVAEQCATFGEDSQVDDVSVKILQHLKEMSEEDRRAILKNVEEKKLLNELMEERKKLKDVG